MIWWEIEFPRWEIELRRWEIKLPRWDFLWIPSLQTPIHKGIHKGGAAEGRPPFVEAAEGRLPYVLPQQRSCLATTHILSFHNTCLVLAEHTFCLATTDILSCHSTHLVFPEQRLCSCRTEEKSNKNIQGRFLTLVRRILDSRPQFCMVFRCASNGICPRSSKNKPTHPKLTILLISILPSVA